MRELRMQEDQLYAMEDYLNQYQSLLRQARAENRELKDRLAAESNELPMPSPPRRGVEEPAAEPPSTPDPTTPATPSTPQPGPVEMPDVPGLDETTLLPDGENAGTSPWDDETGGESAVVPAAWLAEEEQEAISVADAVPATVPAERIALEGEIVSADPGGARLIVDVLPTTAEGMQGSLAGTLSLMILGVEAGAEPTGLARWDFSSSELAAIADQSPEGRLRFYLELPVEAPEGRSQLWSRFLPEGGPKMLASAELKLDSIGHFSSAGLSTAMATKVAEPTAPVHDDTTIEEARIVPRSARERFIDVEDGTWAVATPGQRPPETSADAADWQRSTEPFPHRTPRLGTSAPTRPGVLERKAGGARFPSPDGPLSQRYALPTWSPERTPSTRKDRASQAHEAAVSPPTWSPER